MEDINKDIETIWRELQEIDKITRRDSQEDKQTTNLPQISDQELVIPSWRQRNTGSYHIGQSTPTPVRSSSIRQSRSIEKRNSSLPPVHRNASNKEEIIKPTPVEAKKQSTPRSTIWTFGDSSLNDKENTINNSQKSVHNHPSPTEAGKETPVYSFVPKTETKPEASSPEKIKIEANGSGGRQSRSRTRNKKNEESSVKSRTASAFQQLWPQTYNSFQNRAVRLDL